MGKDAIVFHWWWLCEFVCFEFVFGVFNFEGFDILVGRLLWWLVVMIGWSSHEVVVFRVDWGFMRVHGDLVVDDIEEITRRRRGSKGRATVRLLLLRRVRARVGICLALKVQVLVVRVVEVRVSRLVVWLELHFLAGV